MFKGALYYKLENMTIGLSPTLRGWGQNLFRAGMANQGTMAHEDTIQPSLRCVPISASKFPRLLSVSLNAILNDFAMFLRATGWHPTLRSLAMSLSAREPLSGMELSSVAILLLCPLERIRPFRT